MQIHGFNKLTLLDYPGKLAGTIFLGHCNFRCPFCQNGGLVLHPENEAIISIDEVMQTLKKRQGILEGVCVTGGEPTLHPELEDLIGEIKKLGYAVKLDTNGSRAEVLKSLLEHQMLDYVAMDIKNSQEKYRQTAGISCLHEDAIEESVQLLMHGSIDYEFRTTVTRELHKEEDFHKIGKWIAGCKRYFLQNYRESENVISPIFSSYSKEELEKFREILLGYMENVAIRGI